MNPTCSRNASNPSARPPHARHQNRAVFEDLELRQMLSASAYRSVDGTGNNLTNTDWGSINEDLLRLAAAAYTDGISTPAGANRPSARQISNTVVAHPDDDIESQRSLSAFAYLWGQFIDHDMDLTSAGTAEELDISIPKGDASFDPNSTGTQVIPFTRSIYDTSTGTTSPRQQINQITAWIDGSMVYGSDTARADALRTFVGGKLKTSDGNLMPFNTVGLSNANDAHIFPDNQLFLGGDVRANENIELTAMQTLWVREHNRIATNVAAKHPSWSDQTIYQQTRRLVVAEIQAITYNEFLPALLGHRLPQYQGYNPNMNPDIATEFSTAAFRFGHSMLEDDVEFMDNNGEAVRDPVSLAEAFFNPALLESSGIDPLMKYLATTNSEEIDTKVVDSLRNFLFGPPGSGGLDLASLNIQRGRDHGLADYNTTRAAVGLGRVTSFAQITSDPQLQQQLQSLYGSVDNIDLWVGGLAEDHVPGSSLSPTFQRIVSDQFMRLRDGDRFWYERDLTPRELDIVGGVTLADVIRRNTGITNLQRNVFVYDVSIDGRVFNDANRDGVSQPVERGLANRVIDLIDDDGNVIDSTNTNGAGKYHFDDLDIGEYHLRLQPDEDWVVTLRPRTIRVTRGQAFLKQNFGEALVETDPTEPQDPPTQQPQPQQPLRPLQQPQRPSSQQRPNLPPPLIGGSADPDVLRTEGMSVLT